MGNIYFILYFRDIDILHCEAQEIWPWPVKVLADIITVLTLLILEQLEWVFTLTFFLMISVCLSVGSVKQEHSFVIL